MSQPTRASPVAALQALLAWYREIGVDQFVAERATDWLAAGDRAPGADLVRRWPRQQATAAPAGPAPPAAPRPLPQAQRRTPPAVPVAPVAGESEARTLARGCDTLDALVAALAAFEGCGLKATAKNLCVYRGAPAARVMLIGEAPGREEDLEGRPFVGRAGQLLDKMLAAIGLGESDCHITNVVYWRPPGNRTPTLPETQACRPFLERQIALVAPQIIVTLGGPASQSILAESQGIMRLRGKWRTVAIAGHEARVMPTLHPAYLLRTPAAKRQAWRDLLAVRAALDGA